MLNISHHARERSCPVCGGQENTLFAKEQIDSGKMNEYTFASRKNPEFMCLRLVRCSNCDLVYAPTPPSSDYLSEAYAEASFDSGAEARAAAESYARALRPHLAGIDLQGAAVDVGAGSGALLPWLQSFGFRHVLGIEPSRAAIDATNPEMRPYLREGMFSPKIIDDVQPSLICSFMTLEHISEPGEFVRTAYQLLEPGGRLAVVVHNWQAPLNRLLGLRSPIIDIEHLQLFCPNALQELLRRNGFSQIALQPITNSYPLRYWLRLTPLPQRIKKFFNSLFDQIAVADLKIPLRVGNILAVGTKHLD